MTLPPAGMARGFKQDSTSGRIFLQGVNYEHDLLKN
jgi:hypothetical protein